MPTDAAQQKVYVAVEDIEYAKWQIRHVFGNKEAALEWLSHMRTDHPFPYVFDIEVFEVEEAYAD